MGRGQAEHSEQSEEVSHTLQLRSAVQLDLEDAVIWYEDKQAGLGERFLEQVLEAAARVCERPELYVEVDTEIRRAPVRRFPYWLIYTFDASTVTVIAVVDSRQDPEYIKLRFDA